MTSNPGEKAPGQSAKAAEDIAALARKTPMLTMVDVDKDKRKLGYSSIAPFDRPPELEKCSEGYNIGKAIKASLGLEETVTDSSYSFSQQEAISRNTSQRLSPPMGSEEELLFDIATGNFVKQDVAASDVVKAINQQLRPDEPQS